MNRNLTVLSIIFSVIAIAATFLPWVVYPMAESVLYGYVGDGILSAGMFAISVIWSLFTLFVSKRGRILSIYTVIISAFWAYKMYSNIGDFDASMESYVRQSYLEAQGLVGAHIGSGVYVLMVSSMFSLITACGQLFLGTVGEENRSRNSRYVWMVLGLALLISVGSYIYAYRASLFGVDQNKVEISLASHTENMGQAYKNSDFETFADYTHPEAITMYGGMENYVGILHKSKKLFEDNQATFLGMALDKVEQIVADEGDILAVVIQNLTFEQDGKQLHQKQRLVAVSKNNMKSWKFINITDINKEGNKERILRFFPNLDEKLKL